MKISMDICDDGKAVLFKIIFTIFIKRHPETSQPRHPLNNSFSRLQLQHCKEKLRDFRHRHSVLQSRQQSHDKYLHKAKSQPKKDKANNANINASKVNFDIKCFPNIWICFQLYLMKLLLLQVLCDQKFVFISPKIFFLFLFCFIPVYFYAFGCSCWVTNFHFFIPIF